MKTTLLILIVFTTLSSVALCRSSFLPKTIEISATNSIDHDITVKMSYRTDGMGKPVQSEERVVTVSLPITKSERQLDRVWLIFSSPSGGLSAPLAVEKDKGVAKVNFSIGITHLKAARIYASYSNAEDDSVDVGYSVQLIAFIQKDMAPKKEAEQGSAHQSTTRPESKSE